MIVSTMKLLDFLGEANTTFSIPLFQRPYSWDAWQCEVFWQDVLHAAQTDTSHFFGALFFRQEPAEGDSKTLSVIDGQQRTLTTMLLLSALTETLPKDEATSLTTRYLFNGTQTKATPSAKDIPSFTEALSHPSPEAASDATLPKAAANKAFFARLLRTTNIDAHTVLDGLSKFEVVTIKLEPEDDAQSIFESFNSKGVPLVTADMVRNYLLLSESPDKQKRLYEQYWEHIQGLFGDDPGSLRLNNAIRAWTVIRCKTPHAKSDSEAFGDFKQYVQNEYDGTIDDLLDELRSFCMVWAENYRYHAVKKFRSAHWAKLGRKTLVSGRELAPVSPKTRDFFTNHYGVNMDEVNE